MTTIRIKECRKSCSDQDYATCNHHETLVDGCVTIDDYGPTNPKLWTLLFHKENGEMVVLREIKWEDSEFKQCKKLVQLILQIAREEAYAVLNEHRSDYEHKEKPPEEVDMQ